MKKFILLLVLCCFAIVGFAQDSSVTTADILRYYRIATPSERAAIDSMFVDMEQKQQAIQIKSICGVNFGMSKEAASSILRNKYGSPMYNPNDMMLSFENIKYAGVDFDNVHFLFQSDGQRSYLYSCIFIKAAKNKQRVNEIIDLYKTVLSRKYELSEGTDDNGFKIYGGGVSPLWDGKWYTFMEALDSGEFLTAFHTDVIEYDRDLVNTFGNLYGVRLIYGPFQYVNEEF